MGGMYIHTAGVAFETNWQKSHNPTILCHDPIWWRKSLTPGESVLHSKPKWQKLP